MCLASNRSRDNSLLQSEGGDKCRQPLRAHKNDAVSGIKHSNNNNSGPYLPVYRIRRALQGDGCRTNAPATRGHVSAVNRERARECIRFIMRRGARAVRDSIVVVVVTIESYTVADS